MFVSTTSGESCSQSNTRSLVVYDTVNMYVKRKKVNEIIIIINKRITYAIQFSLYNFVYRVDKFEISLHTIARD